MGTIGSKFKQKPKRLQITDDQNNDKDDHNPSTVNDMFDHD